jgi:hypothetical protein
MYQIFGDTDEVVRAEVYRELTAGPKRHRCETAASPFCEYSVSRSKNPCDASLAK